MMAHLQHNNIHVNLQLFQELNGKFPEVPEDVVKKFMQKFMNNREKCIEVLRTESPKYLYGNFDSVLGPVETTTNQFTDLNIYEARPRSGSTSSAASGGSNNGGVINRTQTPNKVLHHSNSVPQITLAHPAGVHDSKSSPQLQGQHPYGERSHKSAPVRPENFEPYLPSTTNQNFPQIPCSIFNTDFNRSPSTQEPVASGGITQQAIPNVPQYGQYNQQANTGVSYGASMGNWYNQPPQQYNPAAQQGAAAYPVQSQYAASPQEQPQQQLQQSPYHSPQHGYNYMPQTGYPMQQQQPHSMFNISPSAGHASGGYAHSAMPASHYTSQVFLKLSPSSSGGSVNIRQPSTNPLTYYFVHQGAQNAGSGPSTPPHGFPPTVPQGGSPMQFTPPGTYQNVPHPPNLLNINDPETSHITHQPMQPILSPASSHSSLNETPKGDMPGRQSRSGSTGADDIAYTQALLLHQKARMEKLQRDLDKEINTLQMLRTGVSRMEQGDTERRARNSNFPTPSDVAKLREENRRLQIDVQFMANELDMFNQGQTPLGVLDPIEQQSFYKNIGVTGQRGPVRPPPPGTRPLAPPPLPPPLPSLPPARPVSLPAVRPATVAAPPPVPLLPPAEPPQSEGQATASAEEDEGDSWNCSACTFLNHPSLKQCELCEMPRITVGDNGWIVVSPTDKEVRFPDNTADST